MLRQLYRELAAQADDELPTVTDFLDDPAWQELVSAVAVLDREAWSEKTRLRDPSRAFADFRKGTGHGLRGGRIASGAGAAALRTLGELQLFHTPLSTPKPVERKRTDDDRITARWLEYERHDLPEEAELVAGLDFHRIVAAMNQYPTLLRSLGLVVDLVLDRSALADTADAPLWTEVDLPDLEIAKSTDVSPVTHARLQGDDFRAASNPALPADAYRVVDGLLDLDPKRFELLQTDVDGAGLKVMNFARTLGRLGEGDRRVDPVTRQEERPGAPALRTAGLMLVQRGRGGALEQRFAANKQQNDAAEDVFTDQPGALPPELWAEDLVRGFRFDAWDEKTGTWRSLCQRTAVYDLGPGGKEISPEPYEEGTVRLAATTTPDPASNPDLVSLHEAVVSWTGWSLAAPLPGRGVLPDDSVDDTAPETVPEVPPGVPLATRFRALPGSLPRLRFGRRYWLRGRAVDLAGNSLPPQAEDFGPEAPETRARPFLRREPIAPPVIALVRPEGGPTEVPAAGESMERIAIRSFNDVPADNAVPTDAVARRIALPPRTSARDAEQHGMLDAGGVVDPATFDLLAHQKDLGAEDPASSLQEEKVVSVGPLDPTPSETMFAVYREGGPLPHLPDPLATEVAVRVFRHPDVDPATVLTVPLYAQDEAWPEARPFGIRVFEDPGAAPSYDAATHTLLVPLPKAVRAQVRLSMKPAKRTLEKLAVWRWLTEAGLPEAQLHQLAARALDGQHWMLTPWRTLEVVHAVQRPLAEPEIVKHVVSRALRATHAFPRFMASCSIASTARVDLVAEWHEPSDDPERTESAETAVDRARGDVAFSVKVTDPETYAARLDGHDRGGYPEHTVPAPDTLGVGLPGHDLVPPKSHEFGDTRYRRIEYRLEATSRFREFLPADVLTQTVNGDVVPTDERIKVEGPRLVTWIPCSAPPPAPRVLYVVPTFGWERNRDEDGDHTTWRRGGGLRVYLDRPWMVSGYGEMLGVVLPPASFHGDPESEPEAHPYKKYVTQWANDPIWTSRFVPGLAPRRQDFPLARTAADPSGAWLPEAAPEAEAEQPSGPFQVTGLLPPDVPAWPAGAVVEVAPHDVFYDAQRRLWYCDVEVDPKGSYFPFLRLALARYQPVSVSGAHLSAVVLADFMQLAPDRWLHVNHTDEPGVRRVVVYGDTYSDASGHREAKTSGGYSEILPLLDKIVLHEPAEVSPSSVVEVWVERLDPALGEDFGWQRVAGAKITPDGAAGGGGAPGHWSVIDRFVSGERVARALELRAARRFDVLASERLIDTLLPVRPLWSGSVALPAGADPDDRYRIVIAEYEEYLVDDDRPYDRVPEKAGRRLVFVEHVELD